MGDYERIGEAMVAVIRLWVICGAICLVCGAISVGYVLLRLTNLLN